MVAFTNLCLLTFFWAVMNIRKSLLAIFLAELPVWLIIYAKSHETYQVMPLISSYEKITTVTHKQLFIKVHVHAQKSPWTNHWQPLDCGLIIRWSCFKLPLYFPIILDVTHKLFWLLSVVNMNFVLFPTSFDTHSFKCWLPQYL